MKFGRVDYQGNEYYGIIRDGKFCKVPGIQRNDMGFENFALLKELNISELEASFDLNNENLTWLPPVARPSKIICVGRNYLKHVLEVGKAVEDNPILFTKYSDSLVPHMSKIDFPSHGQYLDYEVELAVIIGKTATHVRLSEQPLDYVLGFTIANDLTMRDVQKSEKQWTRGKAFDQSLPIGPWIITVDELKEYKNRDIWLTLNGDKRQLNSTSNMIFDVEFLIRFITEAITLNPGDIILTGTPEGVGFYMDPVSTLQSGDQISCGVTGIGELRFSIK